MKQNALMAITNGTFVGVHRKNGKKHNGKILNISPFYITLFDRNKKETVKVAKTSIKELRAIGCIYNKFN